MNIEKFVVFFKKNAKLTEHGVNFYLNCKMEEKAFSAITSDDLEQMTTKAGKTYMIIKGTKFVHKASDNQVSLSLWGNKPYEKDGSWVFDDSLYLKDSAPNNASAMLEIKDMLKEQGDMLKKITDHFNL